MSLLCSSTEVSRVIHSKSNLLILGPTGTGKSRLAAKIHREGARGGGPFVEVNLATLHEGTLEAELFGAERGAFTGAQTRRVGRVSQAQGGTLFLDEIGDLSLNLQARLLDVIQNKRIYPLGSSRSYSLDTRIIAATHRDLKEMVRKNKFREDLYFRLRVMTLETKPLSSQKESFDRILHEVLNDVSVEQNKIIHKLDREVAILFEAYSWPGNIRELRNVLESAVCATETSEIKLDHLPGWFLDGVSEEIGVKEVKVGSESGSTGLVLTHAERMARFERQILTEMMVKTGWRLRRSAKELGMDSATLSRKLQKLGVKALR